MLVLKRKRKNIKLGGVRRKVGKIWEELGEGKNMTKIHCMKTSSEKNVESAHFYIKEDREPLWLKSSLPFSVLLRYLYILTFYNFFFNNRNKRAKKRKPEMHSL